MHTYIHTYKYTHTHTQYDHNDGVWHGPLKFYIMVVYRSVNITSNTGCFEVQKPTVITSHAWQLRRFRADKWELKLTCFCCSFVSCRVLQNIPRNRPLDFMHININHDIYFTLHTKTWMTTA